MTDSLYFRHLKGKRKIWKLRPVLRNIEFSYTPFGSCMQGRSFASRQMKFGFNAKEQESECDFVDYGQRNYSSNLARFLSTDPLKEQFPWYTTYQFAGNKVIIAKDLDGCEELVVTITQKTDGTEIHQIDYIYTDKKSNERTNKPVTERKIDPLNPSLGTGGIEYRYSDGTIVRKADFDPGSAEEKVMGLKMKYKDATGNIVEGTRKEALGHLNEKSNTIYAGERLTIQTVAEYDNNSNVMKSKTTLLKKIAEKLKKDLNSAVMLIGYTDKDPVPENITPDDPDGNNKLSLERAENVKSELEGLGVSEDQITTAGAGSAQADRTTKNPADRKVTAVHYRKR